MNRENKTNFLLKREWIRYAENARTSAKNWLKDGNGWPRADREREAADYMKSARQSMDRAKTAPVKIVLYYEDGRIETIE